ncbi:MAG TPA: signal recognition particle-docking protein FtsY [Acidimicrobiales bacterium]|jgi:fused signal recognition particle receptor|nr:signal recognition particle-docking protein FtsY [Acidimicrobiales bacterium]
MFRFRRHRDDETIIEEGEEGSAASPEPEVPSTHGEITPPDARGSDEREEIDEGPDAVGSLGDAIDDLADAVAGPTIRGRLGRKIGAPFRSLRRRGRIDDALLAELEDALLIADVGLPTTTRLLDGLRGLARSNEYDDPIGALRDLAVAIFDGDDRELHVSDAPSVWLFVGVNGAGKTTTIGKLARREALAGRGVVIAAGDTFRAAAVEQLSIWADRANVAIVEGGEGADPAAVIFDAKQHASARRADLVLADTAGRLHTKANLMAELEKVRRIADRAPGQVTEVLLVLDATTGQNGLSQARQFTESVGVTGIVLTKLDGSAKGGVVLAIRSELGVPIKLVGLGEGPDDLVAFDPEEFVNALLGE